MGARMGDDCPLGTGSPARIRGYSLWAGNDRGPQLARLHRVLQRGLDHLALSQFHSEKSAALRLRRLCADSLGWSHRCWIRPRTYLQLALRASQSFSIARGTGGYGGLRDCSRHQYLRRSKSLDHAEIRRLYRALISEHQQISTVAVVPVDDARSRVAFSLGRRWRNAPVPAARAGARQGADVLLLAAHPAHSSACGRRLLRALRTGALDVRVAERR